MFRKFMSILAGLLIALTPTFASADEYSDTIKMFADAGQSGTFFKNAYGYAVFPTIGKAAYGVGGAYGTGRVFEQGKHIGNASMTQLSIGWQAGGEGFSQIIFFQDARALKEFTSGNFAFSAEAKAVVITAAAGGKASSTGSSASASGGKSNASTAGSYYKGMATFTITKGGAMVEASVGGQKFSYKPL
jgi:lipid-binding SYLF domain-containing protein